MEENLGCQLLNPIRPGSTYKKLSNSFLSKTGHVGSVSTSLDQKCNKLSMSHRYVKFLVYPLDVSFCLAPFPDIPASVIQSAGFDPARLLTPSACPRAVLPSVWLFFE